MPETGEDISDVVGQNERVPINGQDIGNREPVGNTGRVPSQGNIGSTQDNFDQGRGQDSNIGRQPSGGQSGSVGQRVGQVIERFVGTVTGERDILQGGRQGISDTVGQQGRLPGNGQGNRGGFGNQGNLGNTGGVALQTNVDNVQDNIGNGGNPLNGGQSGTVGGRVGHVIDRIVDSGRGVFGSTSNTNSNPLGLSLPVIG